MSEARSQIMYDIVKSWAHKGGIVYTTEELLDWIDERNARSEVTIRNTVLSECSPWFYDKAEGTIHNDRHSFFSIIGLKKSFLGGEQIEQPIILQNEIGYLGILCKEIGGVIHFLMQAKIEPGNINQIQISPTIQATKSNFTQMHGGNKPAFLDYFLQATPREIVVDQIQSEQSSRFLGKRNRNILILVRDDVEVLDSHRWMTLGQIKQLMRYDNLVNMDTRTVLSCLPFCELADYDGELLSCFDNKPLLQSLTAKPDEDIIREIYHFFNNYKMLEYMPHTLCPLHTLDGWEMRDDGMFCKTSYPFEVVYCDIEIEGREVRRWKQPLFKAVGIACFGLLMYCDGDKLMFVVKAKSEVGCFDGIELGPTYQKEAVGFGIEPKDAMTSFFEKCLHENHGIIFDKLLSEEGGRFYHEQNRNVLICVEKEELPALPDGFFALDYATLNRLVQTNNVLNIQLRNLLSILEV